jgi:hypothetical protein
MTAAEAIQTFMALFACGLGVGMFALAVLK